MTKTVTITLSRYEAECLAKFLGAHPTFGIGTHVTAWPKSNGAQTATKMAIRRAGIKIAEATND
jgi:hypothetical protein